MNTEDSPSGIPTDRPSDGFEEQLGQYVLAAKPSSVVIVGQPPGARWWQEHSAESPLQSLFFGSMEQCLDSLPEADEGNTGETSGHRIALMRFESHNATASDSELAAMLGQAVRRFPERLIISVESKEPDDAAFFAFGFRKLQLEDQGSIRLFEYCLSEYKQVPDWLNARYWANPERYGLADDHDSYSEDGEDDEEE